MDKKKLLIVEDEISYAKHIASTLTQVYGCIVNIAGTYDDAYKTIMQEPDYYDLIVMDFRLKKGQFPLPEFDTTTDNGLKLAEEIYNKKLGIPVIMMTHFAVEIPRWKVMDKGYIADYALKPCKTKERFWDLEIKILNILGIKDTDKYLDRKKNIQNNNFYMS